MKRKRRGMVAVQNVVTFGAVLQQVASLVAWKRGGSPLCVPYTASCLNNYISSRKMFKMKRKRRGMVAVQKVVTFGGVWQQVASLRAWKRGVPRLCVPYTASCVNVYIPSRKMLKMKSKRRGMVAVQNVVTSGGV